MKYFIIFFAFIFCGFAGGNNKPSKMPSPTLKTITKLSTLIKATYDEAYLSQLSKLIDQYSAKYKVDPILVVAIFAQESRFDLHAQNCQNGLSRAGHPAYVCTDFGISQISYSNIKKRKLSVKKLTTDLEYSIENGIKILAETKQYQKKEPNTYWTRYNTSNKYYRKLYQQLVCRYYVKGNLCHNGKDHIKYINGQESI